MLTCPSFLPLLKDWQADPKDPGFRKNPFKAKEALTEMDEKNEDTRHAGCDSRGAICFNDESSVIAADLLYNAFISHSLFGEGDHAMVRLGMMGYVISYSDTWLNKVTPYHLCFPGSDHCIRGAFPIDSCSSPTASNPVAMVYGTCGVRS